MFIFPEHFNCYSGRLERRLLSCRFHPFSLKRYFIVRVKNELWEMFSRGIFMSKLIPKTKIWSMKEVYASLSIITLIWFWLFKNTRYAYRLTLRPLSNVYTTISKSCFFSIFICIMEPVIKMILG